MTPAEYDDFVWSKLDPKVKEGGDIAVLHWSGLKLASESGEFAGEIVKRDFHQRPVNEMVLIYELGDALYPIATGARALGVSLQTVMEMNVAKLTERGDYANYLRQKMEQSGSGPTSEVQDVIDALQATARQIIDRWPEPQDAGELDPAESSSLTVPRDT